VYINLTFWFSFWGKSPKSPTGALTLDPTGYVFSDLLVSPLENAWTHPCVWTFCHGIPNHQCCNRGTNLATTYRLSNMTSIERGPNFVIGSLFKWIQVVSDSKIHSRNKATATTASTVLQSLKDNAKFREKKQISKQYYALVRIFNKL